MAINAVTMTVEMAFGFGPGTTPASGDWVDVTSYVDATATSGAVVATSGRDNVRSGITPGKLSLRLENRDGRFNPRNTAGPYYGKLDVGTQVRVRTTYGGTTRTRWQGFVDSGWPQTITSRWPTVDITAHDILGLLAQSEAPTSAWASYIAASSPSHWWRPGPDGWVDSVTGASLTHTSKLDQASGDAAIINGEESPWGQLNGDGVGFSNGSQVRVLTETQSITVAARVNFLTQVERLSTEPMTVIAQKTSLGTPIAIYVYKDSLDIYALDSDSLREAYTPDTGDNQVRLWDNKAHTLVVHVPANTGTISAWIDGLPVTMTNVSMTVTGSMTFADDAGLYIGGNGGNKPFQGYIDPVVIWRNIGKTSTQLNTFAAELHDAAVTALATRRLDQRVAAVMGDAGLSAHVGTLDTSGIVTQQSYRQADPLEQLQRIEDTEQGRVWVDRNGLLRFSGRTWSWDDIVSNAVQLQFSDDASLLNAGTAQEMLEGGTIITDDPLNICNVALVNSTYGRQQRAENATSVAKYGPRNAVQLSNLLHFSDRQSRSIAEWIVKSQGTPQIRAEQVSFRVENNPSVLAPIAAQIEEGWLVRIRKLTAADTLDLYAHVIGIQHEWEFTGWTVTLTLDSTRTGYSFFKWGSNPATYPGNGTGGSLWGGSVGWSF